MSQIKKIAIVGGGTAGWIAAAMLSLKYPSSLCEIVLVESDDIGTIGVGESTIPPFLDFLSELGIDLVDFIRKTNASFKLGIEFVNWKTIGERYFHPFGKIGIPDLSNRDFFNLLIKLQKNNASFDLTEFSITHAMAKELKFLPHSNDTSSVLSDSRYALHIDAKLAAAYFRDYATAKGVVRKEGIVVSVTQDNEGMIGKIHLKTGEFIEADFFIDCTGFHSLIIDKTLHVDFEDWSHYLPCDRAVVVQTKVESEIPPYTKSIAYDHGWSWQIPLQNRMGNGYVYSSQFCSDELAKQTLLTLLQGDAITEPRVIAFKTGVRTHIWEKNCLAVGLASGFVEPLESTAIHMIIRGVANFMKYFPSSTECNILRNEYNKRMKAEYEEIRDFIILHYCLTAREDTPFWLHCKNMQLPESLQKAIDLYGCQGEIPLESLFLFQESSWWAVADGMGLKPKYYNALADMHDMQQIEQLYAAYKEGLKKFARSLPRHQEFILDNCTAYT